MGMTPYRRPDDRRAQFGHITNPPRSPVPKRFVAPIAIMRTADEADHTVAPAMTTTGLCRRCDRRETCNGTGEQVDRRVRLLLTEDCPEKPLCQPENWT